jgi:hypothetical protein
MKKLIILIVLAFTSFTSYSQQSILAKDATAHIGDSVIVIGKVFSGKLLTNGMTLLNLGDNYPNQQLTVMIPATERPKFNYKPELDLIGQTLLFSGILMDYKGKPQMVIFEPKQIQAAGF